MIIQEKPYDEAIEETTDKRSKPDVLSWTNIGRDNFFGHAGGGLLEWRGFSLTLAQGFLDARAQRGH